MHRDSFFMMLQLTSVFLDRSIPLRVLDVGSCDVSGKGDSYRVIFSSVKNWSYTGLDIQEGSNVDVVVTPDYSWSNIATESYDVVISGQCFEHVEAPWLMAKEMERVVKVGGVCIIAVPWVFAVHRYPLDCWRILPDGLSYLMTGHCNFEELYCGIFNQDCFFVGVRRAEKVVRNRVPRLAITKPVRCHLCLGLMKYLAPKWYCPACGEMFDNLKSWDVRPDASFAFSLAERDAVYALRLKNPDRYKWVPVDNRLESRTPKWNL